MLPKLIGCISPWYCLTCCTEGTKPIGGRLSSLRVPVVLVFGIRLICIVESAHLIVYWGGNYREEVFPRVFIVYISNIVLWCTHDTNFSLLRFNSRSVLSFFSWFLWRLFTGTSRTSSDGRGSHLITTKSWMNPLKCGIIIYYIKYFIITLTCKNFVLPLLNSRMSNHAVQSPVIVLSIRTAQYYILLMIFINDKYC